MEVDFGLPDKDKVEEAPEAQAKKLQVEACMKEEDEVAAESSSDTSVGASGG